MAEKSTEDYAALKAKERGIFCLKLARLAGPGWPDHTFIKGGRVGFLEYKDGPKSPFQPLQKPYLELLSSLGCIAEVAWTNEQVDNFLERFDP